MRSSTLGYSIAAMCLGWTLPGLYLGAPGWEIGLMLLTAAAVFITAVSERRRGK